MTNTGRTPLSKAIQRERNTHTPDNPDAPDTTRESETLADTPGLSARKTRIEGENVGLETPETSITFEDEHGLLSGDYGRPRPSEFWIAKQLGKTPQMQLIKHAITQQLTGGSVKVVSEDELSGPLSDLASLIEDIYDGPHFQEKSLDDLITDTTSDLVDTGMAYWEILPSESGEYPVAGFKPIPALQMQHHVDEDSGEFLDDPAFYQVPFKRQHGSVNVTESDPDELDREKVVVMRAPLSSENDSTYGQSLAMKVREWLELITDVDVHQKRHYSDSQLPSGFLHFMGALDDDDLKEIEQDIVEVSGDPHELVTTSSEGEAQWIPVGDSVADLDSIKQSQWYYKLVLAAAGLNQSEINILEESGFAKEMPMQVKQVFKKVTKPYKSAIFDPQNTQVLPRIYDGFDADVSDADLQIDLERFDPLQEQVEREETMKEWKQGAISLNELRAELGREAVEYPMELEGVGDDDVDLADVPRRIVDLLLKRDRPEVNVDGEGGGDGE